MSRIKGGTTTKNRKKKYFKAAKGYRMGKSKLYRQMKEQVEKGWQYAYRDRKQKKRTFRSLWIVRINAACRLYDLSYSKFISGLKKANVNIDRKMLSEIAVNDNNGFARLAALSKESLGIK